MPDFEEMVPPGGRLRRSIPSQAEILNDIQDEEFVLDPSPWFNRVRESTPVFVSDDGGIAFTRYDDCTAVLRDHRLGRADFDVPLPIPALKTFMRNFLMLNPPDHTRIRGLVTKAFTPPALARMRANVEAIADELCLALPDAVGDDGTVDFVTAYARPLPTRVIADVLGVPMSDSPDFMRWSSTLIATLDVNPIANGNPMDLVNACVEFVGYMKELFAAKRARPADDLCSVLVAAHDEGKADEDEALAAAMLLLIAGHETTVNLLAMGTRDLMAHRDQWDRLVADRSLAKTAPDELLRFNGPVSMTGRMAFEDLEINGVGIAKGGFAGAFLAAANRDPRHFDEPEKLDIGRSPNNHLAFASGIHFCVGAGLARMEAEVGLAALAAHHPKLEQAGTETPRPSWALRGLLALPVQVG